MRRLLTLIIVVAVIVIVSVNFFNGSLNVAYMSITTGEFSEEKFQSLGKDFKIDPSKAESIVEDPDGIPNSSDEQVLTKYEGCTFRNMEEAFDKCKIARLKIVEKMENGSCIGIGPNEEKNYDIGLCDVKVNEFVMAIIEP